MHYPHTHTHTRIQSSMGNGSFFRLLEIGSELRICSPIFLRTTHRHEKKKKDSFSKIPNMHNWPKQETKNNSTNSARTQTQAHRETDAAATYSFDLISSSCSFLLNIFFFPSSTLSFVHSFGAESGTSRIGRMKFIQFCTHTTSFCMQKSFSFYYAVIFLERFLFTAQLKVRFRVGSYGYTLSFDGQNLRRISIAHIDSQSISEYKILCSKIKVVSRMQPNEHVSDTNKTWMWWIRWFRHFSAKRCITSNRELREKKISYAPSPQQAFGCHGLCSQAVSVSFVAVLLNGFSRHRRHSSAIFCACSWSRAAQS